MTTTKRPARGTPKPSPVPALQTPDDAKHWDDVCAAIRTEMVSKFPMFELNGDLQTLLAVTSSASGVITRQQKQIAICSHIIHNSNPNKPKPTELKSSFGRVIVTAAIPIIPFFVALPSH